MLDIPLQRPNHSQDEVVAREDGAGASLRAGRQRCARPLIAALKFHPADQIPHRTSHGSSPSRGIEWLQVEATRSHHADVRLGSHLKQFVPAGE